MIQQYHNTIGNKFNLPPFWALGWHEASAKIKSSDDVTSIVKKYRDAGIPLDAIYLDEQYLSSDFTPSTSFKFDDIKKTLTTNNVKLVLAVPPAIVADTTANSYYD
jgi:alpha-glucosidase